MKKMEIIINHDIYEEIINKIDGNKIDWIEQELYNSITKVKKGKTKMNKSKSTALAAATAFLTSVAVSDIAENDDIKKIAVAMLEQSTKLADCPACPEPPPQEPFYSIRKEYKKV
jgi:hypothetical protein